MHAWDAIQRSVDYVEENIKEELSIEELAKVSYLSVYYFKNYLTVWLEKQLMSISKREE